MLQSTAINLILAQTQNQILVVEADGGAGKTYAAMSAISRLSSDKSVLVTAPTHVALDELRTKLFAETVCDVTFATTASAVGRYLHMNKATGELENRFRSTGLDYDLIVIDELSAVPAVDFNRLAKSTSPIVALGDRAQLDAVMSKRAKVWTEDCWDLLLGNRGCDTIVEHLAKVVTYITIYGNKRATGALAEFANKYHGKIQHLHTTISKSIRVCYGAAELHQDFLDSVLSAYSEGKSTAQYCYLAYRNSTVAEVHRLLRTKVFCSDNFVEGESVRVSSDSSLRTGAMATVLQCQPAQSVVAGHTVQINNVELRLSCGETRWVKAIAPMFVDQFAQTLADLKQSQSWATFFLLEQSFSVLTNANAMTCHKSQGRTIDYVWVDVLDIGARHRMLYVAYSRAAKVVTAVWDYDGWATKYHGGRTLAELKASQVDFQAS